jgi:predicted glycosyltransferase
MDPGFSELFPTDANLSLTEVQEERKAILYSLFEKTTPDLFMVELYPFGRKRFGFELLPILEEVKNGGFGSPGVVCSLRDILVEKEDQKAYERRVVGLLNQYFDALLIHSDPRLVSIEETFLSTAEIRLPVVYTGFVTSRPDPDAGIKLRNRLKIAADDVLVVASAGGGKVGATLLRAVIEAGFIMARVKKLRLYVFCGPLMSEFDFAGLSKRAAAMPGVEVARFTKEFVSFLTAADLSVSMAGYNTCMNILAAGVPALVWPFGQNREHRLRAEKLDGLGCLTMLSDFDLMPSRLAMIMGETLQKQRHPAEVSVKLDGALETARWLEAWRGSKNSKTS